jgi:predicted nucleic acid-binding protein
VNDNRAVVDACIVVKWFVEEENFERARALGRRIRSSLAPDLLLAEAGSAFLKKARRQEMSAADVLTALATIPQEVTLFPCTSLLSAAYRIAFTYGRSFYDSLYVALALQEECQFVTADERLFNALRSAYPQTLVWIGDLS